MTVRRTRYLASSLGLTSLGLILGLAMIVPASGDETLPIPRAGQPAKGRPNRLAKESSPYLLQHAFNPVDWYPWCPEAFERAKKEQKLIFLSIGYSSCHWCHVMDRESFADPEIARLLNDNFVCIKVDREERPDIDDIYMTALGVIGEPGGWPLTMFLMPDGKPIFGGTYFPPEDRKTDGGTLPGMKTILAKVIELNSKEHEGLVKQADSVARATADALERNNRAIALVPLDHRLVESAAEAFDIDPQYGGTGSKARMYQGTKFPRPPVWQFLLARSQRPGHDRLADLVHLTLREMAQGGIYDHLGGGFHRYSTDRTWTVPHFEKMLYDNAQLVELYSAAYAVRPEPLYRHVVEQTLAFVKREMTSPEGAFYSALDAETNHKEGEFYVWTTAQLQEVLGADFPFFRSVYDVAAPNFEGKYHILRLSKPLARIARERDLTEAELLTRLEPLRRKLAEARAKRLRPFLDTKVITAWNGQMIAGYARAGQVFKNSDFIRAAATAAEFVLNRMRDRDGRLFRIYAAVPGEKPVARGTAFLDDYAYFVHGLLNLHDATGDERWLKSARELIEITIRYHGDGDRGGYFYTPSDGEKLFARGKDAYDGVQPSGNSQMARNLVRLAAKTGERRYRDLAEKTLKSFGLALRMQPTSLPTMALALDEFLQTARGPTDTADPSGTLKKPRESAEVVTARLRLSPPTDGRRTATVGLKIEPGWHIYANPVGDDGLIESQTLLRVFVDGREVTADVTYPPGMPTTDASGARYAVYRGEAVLTARFPVEGESSVEVHVAVVACREGRCLLPSTIRLKPDGRGGR